MMWSCCCTLCRSPVTIHMCCSSNHGAALYNIWIVCAVIRMQFDYLCLCCLAEGCDACQIHSIFAGTLLSLLESNSTGHQARLQQVATVLEHVHLLWRTNTCHQTGTHLVVAECTVLLPSASCCNMYWFTSGLETRVQTSSARISMLCDNQAA
jgi:hypothetical protein